LRPVLVSEAAQQSQEKSVQKTKGVDNAAVHTIIIMFLLVVLYTVPLFVFSDDIFRAIGAGRTTATAALYARIMFSATIISFFSFIANAILRSEGDAKRAMLAMVLGGILNAVLDPIFIYVLGLSLVRHGSQSSP
jgi:Na+-driven multidrug efflux pump